MAEQIFKLREQKRKLEVSLTYSILTQEERSLIYTLIQTITEQLSKLESTLYYQQASPKTM